jgi:hypothetical protein
MHGLLVPSGRPRYAKGSFSILHPNERASMFCTIIHIDRKNCCFVEINLETGVFMVNRQMPWVCLSWGRMYAGGSGGDKVN